MRNSALNLDPLLDSLVFVAKFHGQPHSVATLCSGLPLGNKNKLTPALFSRAAGRAGLSSRLVRQPLDRISDLVLPCILLLANGDTCVLLGFDEEREKARVVFPCTDHGEAWAAVDKLKTSYSGDCFFLAREYKFDERAPKTLNTRKGHWFWSAVTQSRGIYRDVLVASLLINLFAITSPLFVMNVYDRVVPNLAFDSLWVLAAGASMVFLFDFIIRQLRSYFIDIAGKKSDLILSARIFAQVMGIRLEARPASVGAFTRHLSEFESVRDFLTSATLTAFIDLPFATIFLLVIWLFAGNLVLVPIIAVLILLIMALLVQGRLKHCIEEGSRLSTQKYANLVESVSGLEDVKLTRSEGVFQHKWEQAVGHISSWGIKNRQLNSFVASSANLLQQMTTVALIVYGVYLIAEAELSMGGLIASVMLSSRAIVPFVQLANLSTRYNQAKSSFSILEGIMNSPVEEGDDTHRIHRPNLRGEIDIQNVSFTYPDVQQQSLNQVNLHIAAGEKVGIIGRIGSGKTTLERMISGLYQPSQGAVMFDGVDLRQWHTSDFRSQIGVVSQDARLFFGSIRDNIVMGNAYATDAAVIKAAKVAGVTEFTDQETDGLQRQVGEGGRYLSGGQRQAVLLARALVNQPKMLILDEPTSNMDSRAETRIKQLLGKLPSFVSLIMVTHNTTLLDVVDRLIVMDKGRVVADGPRDEVLSKLKDGQIHQNKGQHG